jgi:hypothetical protein
MICPTARKIVRWHFRATCMVVCSGAPAFAGSADDGGQAILGFILLALIISLYFLPAIIGGKRGINASGALFFVNLIFGWTVLGWLVCLIWAASGATRAQDEFFKTAATSRPTLSPAASDMAYREAYARERARLDHEAATKPRT